MHATLSRDGNWVLINARPDGGLRQIVLVYIGGLFYVGDNSLRLDVQSG